MLKGSCSNAKSLRWLTIPWNTQFRYIMTSLAPKPDIVEYCLLPVQSHKQYSPLKAAIRLVCYWYRLKAEPLRESVAEMTYLSNSYLWLSKKLGRHFHFSSQLRIDWWRHTRSHEVEPHWLIDGDMGDSPLNGDGWLPGPHSTPDSPKYHLSILSPPANHR